MVVLKGKIREKRYLIWKEKCGRWEGLWKSSEIWHVIHIYLEYIQWEDWASFENDSFSSSLWIFFTQTAGWIDSEVGTQTLLNWKNPNVLKTFWNFSVCYFFSVRENNLQCSRTNWTALIVILAARDAFVVSLVHNFWKILLSLHPSINPSFNQSTFTH